MSLVSALHLATVHISRFGGEGWRVEGREFCRHDRVPGFFSVKSAVPSTSGTTFEGAGIKPHKEISYSYAGWYSVHAYFTQLYINPRLYYV